MINKKFSRNDKSFVQQYSIKILSISVFTCIAYIFKDEDGYGCWFTVCTIRACFTSSTFSLIINVVGSYEDDDALRLWCNNICQMVYDLVTPKTIGQASLPFHIVCIVIIFFFHLQLWYVVFILCVFLCNWYLTLNTDFRTFFFNMQFTAATV